MCPPVIHLRWKICELSFSILTSQNVCASQDQTRWATGKSVLDENEIIVQLLLREPDFLCGLEASSGEESLVYLLAVWSQSDWLQVWFDSDCAYLYGTAVCPWTRWNSQQVLLPQPPRPHLASLRKKMVGEGDGGPGKRIIITFLRQGASVAQVCTLVYRGGFR